MAVKVVDKQAQQEVEVGSAEAQEGFLEGRYVVPAGPVRIARANSTGTVDAGDLPTALAQGWRVVDDAEAEEVTIRREESDAGSLALGGLEALAAGVTMGGSTWALERSGMIDADRARARRDNLDELGTALEVAGGLGAAALTGGGSLAARGGGTLARLARYTPAGAVERVGVATERAVAGALGTGRTARVLAPTARGAVEGFYAGAGAELDESVLGKREIAAEALVGSGLSGALLGGGLGGALPVAGAGLAKLAEPSEAALRRVWGRATGAPGGEGSKAIGKALAEGDDDLLEEAAGDGGDGWVRGYARLFGGDEEAFVRTKQRLATPEGRARLLGDLDGQRAKSAEGIKAAVDKANAAVDEAVQLAAGAGKLKRLDELLADADAPKKGARGRFVRRPRGYALEHLQQQRAQIDELLADELLPPELRRDLAKAARINERALEKAGTIKKASEAYKAIDDYKRELDVLAQGRAQQFKRSASPEIQEAANLLRGLAGQARKHLELEDIYGGAATMQKEINAAASRELGALSELGKKSPTLRKMLERGSEADSDTALQLARMYGKTKGEVRVNAVDQALDARLEYLRAVQKHHEMTPELSAAIDTAEREIKAMRQQLADQAETAGALDDLWKLREAEGGKSPSITVMSTLGPALGGGLGFGLGGLPGALVGGALGSVTRPYTTARSLASMLNTVEGFKARFGAGSALGGLRAAGGQAASGVAGVAERLIASARKVRPPVASSVFGSGGRGGDREAKLEKLTERTTMLAQNPDALAREVQAAMGEVDEVAPGVATAAGALSAKVVGYLASKAPAVYTPPFLGGKPMIDPTEAAAFRRRVEAAVDPIGTMDLVDTGELTVEHVEALEACYPEHLAELREEVTEGLYQALHGGKAVESWLRLQLGGLLGLPTDVTLDPDLLGELQAVHVTAEQQQEAAEAQQAAGPKVSAAGAAKVKLADRQKSAMDRITGGDARS